MSDRKYRQRGYQDDDRDRPAAPKPQRPAPEPGAPAGARRISQDGPRNINMPGYREVVRCAQCGTVGSSDVGLDSRCPRCGVDLHACAQCTSFDPGSRFECMQQIPGAHHTQERQELLRALLAPAPPSNGKPPRRAPTMRERRLTICSSSRSQAHGVAF